MRKPMANTGDTSLGSHLTRVPCHGGQMTPAPRNEESDRLYSNVSCLSEHTTYINKSFVFQNLTSV